MVWVFGYLTSGALENLGDLVENFNSGNRGAFEQGGMVYFWRVDVSFDAVRRGREKEVAVIARFDVAHTRITQIYLNTTGELFYTSSN